MKILLDTHVFLWGILEPERLSKQMRLAMASADNALYLSAISMWEIGVKYGLGKLPLVASPELLVPQQMRLQGILWLPFGPEHAALAHSLPLHHRDPFDRMLIAQAMAESLPLMTADPQFRRYRVKILA